jgi:hypothetical protein
MSHGVVRLGAACVITARANRPVEPARSPTPGANPTIASYNASTVKIYSAVNSITRL